MVALQKETVYDMDCSVVLEWMLDASSGRLEGTDQMRDAQRTHEQS